MNLRRYLQIKKYPSFFRRIIKSVFEIFICMFFLPIKFGLNFWQLNKLIKLRRKELEIYYKEYIEQISGDYMAISLELATFLLVTCEILKPKNILDLGSGFSSFVFRYYQARADIKPTVWSFDDNSEWLDKTKQFLSAHNLSVDNLIIWSSFSNYKNHRFDLISHDLGNMDLRKKTFEDALSVLGHNGVLILDDIHKYENFVRNFLQKTNCKYYNLKYYTKDKFNRYSFLVSESK